MRKTKSLVLRVSQQLAMLDNRPVEKFSNPEKTIRRISICLCRDSPVTRRISSRLHRRL